MTEPPAGEFCEQLLRRVQALPETAMRREVLLEQLVGREAGEVLDFLRLVLAGVERRRRGAMRVLDAVHELVLCGQARAEVYELLAEVYLLARDQQLESVVNLLRITGPQRGPVGPDIAKPDVELSRLALGERKALARKRDRFRLERLLLDPDPAVVRNLLANPAMTEADAVRLAARRPVLAEVLREVYASRFGHRPRVRLSLVCNPYTPTELALKLVGFLLRSELRQVAEDGSLHELVRAEARRLYRRRRGKTSEP